MYSAAQKISISHSECTSASLINLMVPCDAEMPLLTCTGCTQINMTHPPSTSSYNKAEYNVCPPVE